MSGPTQELPSWFTISTTILTDAAGNPTATSESLLYLPLTYYGPSIPLGSLWTYGGLTSPASTSSTTPTETSTSVTPITSSVSSSSPLTSVSSTSSVASTSSFALPTPSPTSGASGESGLSRGQLVGIIVGSIIGFIFLLILLLLLFICCSNRRKRQNPRFSMVAPIEEDYYIVGPGGESPEGSPRSSGEVEDSFLRRGAERKSAPITQPMSNVPPSAAGVVGADNGSNSQNNSLGSSRSSNSAASGYGHEIPSALSNSYEDTADSFGQRWRGNILSREQLRRLDEEEEPDDTLVHSEHNFGAEDKDKANDLLPLIPPPRLVDPERSRSRLSQRSTPSHGSHLSGDLNEATVHTARRVRAEDLAPRSSTVSTTTNPFEEPVAGPSGHSHRDSGVWKGLGTLAAAAGLGRWFSSSNPSSRRNSAAPGLSSTLLGDNDIEQARTLLNDPDNFPSPPPQMTEFRRTGSSGLGLMATGDRPISSVSAKSGTSTVYYDAYSTPGTPYGERGTPLPALPAPLPRALANSSSAEMGYWTPPVTTPLQSSSSRGMEPSSGPESGSGSGTATQGLYSHPRHYDAATLSSTAEDTPGHSLGPNDSGIDILDMPIPRGMSPFASTSSLRDTLDKDRDTITTPNSSLGSSSAKKGGLKFPPGLGGLPTPSVWHDTQGTTPSPGSFAAGSRGGSTAHLPEDNANRLSTGTGDAGITIDVLEEAPPTAGAQWRTLATSGFTGFPFGGERRTTFGMPHLVHQHPDHISEIGSLHSMRSHLSPHSSRSAGSAAASRRDASGSTGSNSSRPSAAGARSVLSSSEGGHSLSHSGSISSDGRKRNHKPGNGTMSPALSAFGHSGRGPSGATSSTHPISHGRFPTSTISEVEDARVRLNLLSGGPGSVTIDGSEEASASASRSAPTSPRIGRTLYPQPHSHYDRSLSLSPIPWAGGLEDSWQPS
ncbi:hypothetical protein D9758_005476 [Tetrapyrgos nigripes]|uniref:Uncharacterized protein n=1 Tax=Tetrapyrgos nigripes TaxID=182062 RepID=A0A8H5GI98_9AGAR|nr:hypothetical protein D9758_005476 [Tetrapyrgos nigripes]